MYAKFISTNWVMQCLLSSQLQQWESNVDWATQWFSLYTEFHNIHWVTSVDQVQDYLEVINIDWASTSTECMTCWALIVDSEYQNLTKPVFKT